MARNNGHPIDMTGNHKYRCSICGGEFGAEQVVEHMEEEKAKPTWPGKLSYTLVGGPFDKEE